MMFMCNRGDVFYITSNNKWFFFMWYFCWINPCRIIVNDLIPNNRLGLYINRNAFSWKMIIWKVWALILNFTTMKHGGARGGAESFWWLVNLSDSSEFWKIPTFLRLWEGRWWRGAWRGAKMEGRVEGRVLAYMAGRQRGAGSIYTAFDS